MCVQACLGCNRCNFVSYSAKRRECAWYHSCNFATQLQTLPQYPDAHGESFVTIEVKKWALPSAEEAVHGRRAGFRRREGRDINVAKSTGFPEDLVLPTTAVRQDGSGIHVHAWP
eukprot:4786548-Prymnesium_polylepis.1